MQVSVYFNDNGVVNSVDIYEASLDECISIIRKFNFGENKEEEEWLYSDNQKIRYRVEDSDKIRIKNLTYEVSALKDTLNDVQDECDEWKEKYKIECHNHDLIKTSYDSLTESFKELIKERDEYKEIVSDRDDLKIENDKVKELCEMLQIEKDELEKRFKLVRDDYYEAINQVSELIGEKDKLEKENEKLKKDRNLYEYYLKKILFDKGYSNEAMTFLKVMEGKECQQKKSES